MATGEENPDISKLSDQDFDALYDRCVQIRNSHCIVRILARGIATAGKDPLATGAISVQRRWINEEAGIARLDCLGVEGCVGYAILHAQLELSNAVNCAQDTTLFLPKQG